MQGKWTLEVGPDSSATAPTTRLTYAVEVSLQPSLLRMLGMVEPLVEQAAVEDIPSALTALQNAAELSIASARDEEGLRDLATFDALRAELTRLYGVDMRMPSRTELLDESRCVCFSCCAQAAGEVSTRCINAPQPALLLVTANL